MTNTMAAILPLIFAVILQNQPGTSLDVTIPKLYNGHFSVSLPSDMPPGSPVAIHVNVKDDPRKHEEFEENELIEEGSGVEPKNVTDSTHSSQHLLKAMVYFSANYQGNINYWSLNLASKSSFKTLCFDPGMVAAFKDAPDTSITVTVFSNAKETIDINIEARPISDFKLRTDELVRAHLIPGSSKVFHFDMSEEDKDENFVLTVESEENDDRCVYVSLDKPGCPYNDDVRTVKNSQMWARMLKVGYFPIAASSFPNSFVVKLTSLEDSSGCFKNQKLDPYFNATKGDAADKVVTLKIEKTLKSYKKPVILAMFTIIVASLVLLLLWFILFRYQMEINIKTNTVRMSMICNGNVQEDIDHKVQPDDVPITDDNEYKVNLCRDIQLKVTNTPTLKKNEKITYALERLLPVIKDGDKIIDRDITVADMSKLIRNDVWHRRQRSKVYFYLVPLLSLFYLIPSAQLVYYEKQRAEESGSLEQCYLNYGCSRPYGIFTDFNHIISNFGYIWYGVIFLLLVNLKSRYLPEQNRTNCDHMGKLGIPQQHSIFFTLGIGMIMQGIFSMIFHICPSNISLQFDTTMMYVMMSLCFAKIYQFRHPDIAMNAYHLMYCLAFTLIMEALSLYIFRTGTKAIFYSVFSLFYLFLIIYLISDSYYYGMIKTSFRDMLPIFSRHIFGRCKHCMDAKRFVHSFIFAVINFGLLIVTVTRADASGVNGLSTPILLIFAVNLGLYLLYYSIRKLIEIFVRLDTDSECQDHNHEDLNASPGCCKPLMRFLSFMFFLLALVLMGGAAYFYIHKHQSRNLSPPESRNKNSVCSFMDFYDNHDMWHFISATALFSTFIGLLTIDDDLLSKKRDKIQVF